MEKREKGGIAVRKAEKYAAFRSAARGAVAKTDQNDRGMYLPLWLHAADTAAVMERLFSGWLPAAACRCLAERMTEETCKKLVVFLGLTHDFGKATAVFQSRIHAALDEQESTALPSFPPQHFPDAGKVPHARASEAILLWLGCANSVAAVAGAHHGTPQTMGVDLEDGADFDCWPRNYFGNSAKYEALWQTCWKEMFDAALAIAGFSSVDELPALSMPEQILLTGLLVMADWIASNTTYFPLLAVGSDLTAEQSLTRIDAAWGKLRLPAPWQPLCYAMDDEMFAERFGFLPNAVQTAMLQAVENAAQPGIFILEAQMGVGKTEAALAAAEVLASRQSDGGLFFGLPTQATANGLFARLEQWADYQSADEVHGIRLAHGMAQLNEAYQRLFQGTATVDEDGERESGLIVHRWFGGRKQALLTDFVVGTVDQLLLAALVQKHIMLRHLGLAGKVVVVDECHAYDAYMNCYLERALAWLGRYGAPVIVLSATLPAERRTQLTKAYLRGAAATQEEIKAIAAEQTAPWQINRAYPLLTWTDGQSVRQQAIESAQTPRTVQIAWAEDDALVGLLREQLADGGCAGVIVNTVARAQQMAKTLQEQLPEREIVVLHARFVMTDRAKKEEMLLGRLGKKSVSAQRNGLIVVGTQVLEQSLDIDFDFLCTDLCPMDLLLQRIGRLHRHDRTRPNRLRRACCAVLGVADDAFEAGAEAIYGKWLLMQTAARLPQQIMLPADIPTLVQDVYQTPTADGLSEDEQAAWQEYQNKTTDQERRAESFAVDGPPQDMQASMKEWLNRTYCDTDLQAEAKVRDGASSLEVLVLVRGADHMLFAASDTEGAKPFDPTCVPDEQSCRMIARERLRLPLRFSGERTVDRAIRELETTSHTVLPEWQQSHWLRGELFLLLEEDQTVVLCNYALRYSAEMGLEEYGKITNEQQK